MNNLNFDDSQGYDEKMILSDYRKYVNDKILKTSLYSMSVYIAVVAIYFIYSDIHFRNIEFIIPWRIPSIIMAITVLILRKSFLKDNIIIMFVAYNLTLFLCCFMVAGITFSLFNTDLFEASINGTIVAIFAIYIGTFGGFRILFFNYLPVFISIVIIYFMFNPTLSIMAEFGNVIFLTIACFSLSQIQENLRFNEFRSRKIAEFEKDKSNAMLLNILPSEAVEELKNTGTVKSKKFENATILFTDFSNFTSKAEHVEPEKLVKSIDFYFRSFDAIIEKHQLEKIKTIGDSYMCAGGLPDLSKGHELKVSRAALEILDFVNFEAIKNTEIEHFDIRIGIHSGPVVAGIVGVKKFQYDVWGDTVNIASRMESAADVGSINISDITYKVIKNNFECQNRGEIKIKNRGVRQMYFLKHEKKDG